MSDAPPAAPGGDILNQLFSAKPPETPLEMREMLASFAGMINVDLPEVGAFHEGVLVREIDGERVTADIVVPTGKGPHPVLVYLHGGGWICGSPLTHRKLAYRFAEAGYLVINVDYRLAPEAPFPAPFDDCVHAIHWAAEVAHQYGGDASRLAVGGDSAGGNLSAAAAVALRDQPDAPRISAALLIYGVFDFARIGEVPEGMGFPEGPMADLGPKMTQLMVGSYLGADPGPSVLEDPRVSPVWQAEKLPPSHVLVGGADPLVAQAEELVARLRKAGIEHEHVVVDAMPHGYVQMEFFPQARESIAQMVAFLRKHVG